MLKRLSINVFLEDDDYTRLVTSINKIKDLSKNISNEKSSIQVHDCGHDKNKPCTNKVVLL
ncbi:hypothetical protein CMI37_24995 [Candidatus Pacearchaeota archaeon]|nr:hypothetical protein [Candidatus Pacearchaeota archaeon]|tara:strand:- start:372 stop:554 length:183 start_codon:yes stop_codon:yes gene_type:complete